MTKQLRIGLAGMGHVGAVLAEEINLYGALSGLSLAAYSARQPRAHLSVPFVADATALATHPDVDVVVELMGGADGAALGLVEQALQNGKPVITANKAMLAKHGGRLAALAEQQNVSLRFEAAVAGGIPIIKTMRESLAANRLTRVQGLLNGTCNYMLTRITTERADFAAVLADAQKLGYAEAEPSFDIDGHDAAQKLQILAMLAFGCANVVTEVSGIRSITPFDTAMAEKLGYKIKLVADAALHNEQLQLSVGACLVPHSHPLAAIDGVLNGVLISAAPVGHLCLSGPGAGGAATASSVLADLHDERAGRLVLPFLRPAATLKTMPLLPPAQQQQAAYIRLAVRDEAGVIAAIATILRDAGISLSSLHQDSAAVGQVVPVVLITHAAPKAAFYSALQQLRALSCLAADPVFCPLIC